MKIAIYGPEFNERSQSAIVQLSEHLSKKSACVFVEENFYHSILEQSTIEIDSYGFETFKTLDSTFDLLISVGGDGTILRAITHVKDLDIPIVGINTGRLGFGYHKKRRYCWGFRSNFEGKYHISKRTVLCVHTDREEANFDLDFALNEITVSRKIPPP